MHQQQKLKDIPPTFSTMPDTPPYLTGGDLARKLVHDTVQGIPRVYPRSGQGQAIPTEALMNLPHAGSSGRAARLDVREMEASDHRGLRRLAGDVFQVHGEAL